MRISFNEMQAQLKRVLLALSFTEKKASLCASIFAGNSLDGVYSHGTHWMRGITYGWQAADAGSIMVSQKALPIGYWKGSGLSMLLDILLTSLSGGRSTAAISKAGKEHDVTQCFICFRPTGNHAHLVDEIIRFTKNNPAAIPGNNILYTGENTLLTRTKNQQQGIPVNEDTWKEILRMQR